jgi:hypothetical protein
MAKYVFVEMRSPGAVVWPTFLVDDEFPANDAALRPVSSYAEARLRGQEFGARGRVNIQPIPLPGTPLHL